MSISFSCESCKKKIKAPDKAGGKWGKCPYCEHKCYIPLPPAPEEEELTLAPLDETHETSYEEKMQQMRDVTDDILQVKDEPQDEIGIGEMNSGDMRNVVIVYLRQMADGLLAEAEGTAALIANSRAAGLKVLDELEIASEVDPKLSDISPGVLFGLIKKLRSELG
jgi:hypothetical protein